MMRLALLNIFAALTLTASAADGDAARLLKSARAADDAGKPAIALPLYLKADSAFTAAGADAGADYALALHLTGRAYLSAGEMASGREYTLKAARLREKLFGRVSKDYITSMNNYGLSFVLSDEPDKAVKPLTEVVELCRKMNPPHPDEGAYLINLGRALHAAGNDGEAVKYFEEALGKVEKFGQYYEYALNVLGSVYMDAEDNANVKRILGLMEEHNRHELTKDCNSPDCHLERAEYYQTACRHAEAKDEFMAAFAMEMDDATRIRACLKYASFLSSQNDFAQAGEYYSMAAATMKSRNGESETATRTNYIAGLNHFIGGNYEKAAEAHRSVIADVDAHGYDEKLKSSALLGLGNAYKVLKDYEAAAKTYRAQIKHLEDYGHTADADYAKAYENLAATEKFGKAYDSSLADYDKAIELYGALGMADERENALAGKKMCLFYARKNDGSGPDGDNTAAEEQRRERLQEIIRSSLNSLEQGGEYLGKLCNAQTLATIAGSYAMLGEYDKAIEHYALYLIALRPAIAEDFLLKSPKERALTWARELTNINEMNAMAVSLPPNAPDLYGRLAALVYEGQLLSKGILLSSSIEFDRILNRYGTDEMKAAYTAIKDNLDRIEKMRGEHKPLDEILALQRETDAMQLALARESAQFADYTDYLKISLDDVTRALDDKSGAVEFVTLQTGVVPSLNLVAAVVVSKELPGGIIVPVATVKELAKMSEDYDKFGRNEYTEKVWGNIMRVLPGKERIYFAPDGILHNLAIEYFNVGGRQLSDVIDLVRVSSTKEICRRHKRQPIRYAAVFGDIDYEGEGLASATKRGVVKRASDALWFMPLDSTRREINEIDRLLKDGNPNATIALYAGREAAKNEFLSQSQQPVNLIHIATHGKYLDEVQSTDADAMNRSILAFAGANIYDSPEENGALVNAAEIAGMTLFDCELAVLSACESGLGKLGNDGVFGLQRGFKNAGVKSLLVSLNEVTDAATADMMVSFYRHFLNDKDTTKREALRKAQSEIRARNDGDDTWASFILIDSFD